MRIAKRRERERTVVVTRLTDNNTAPSGGIHYSTDLHGLLFNLVSSVSIHPASRTQHQPDIDREIERGKVPKVREAKRRERGREGEREREREKEKECLSLSLN
jgi:hypothetical protein